jgi:hypothetical protein
MIQPNSYSWVQVSDNNIVESLSEKRLPQDGTTWYPICGNFSFSSPELAKTLIRLSLEKNSKKLSEVHFESVIKIALEENVRVQIYDVANFLTIGTPAEANLSDYWTK